MISLEDNAIGPAGMISLATGFAFNNNLLILTFVVWFLTSKVSPLRLSFNKATDACGAALGDAIQKNCALQKLMYLRSPLDAAHDAAWIPIRLVMLEPQHCSRESNATCPCSSSRLSLLIYFILT